jgi:hypothetical protein
MSAGRGATVIRTVLGMLLAGILLGRAAGAGQAAFSSISPDGNEGGAHPGPAPAAQVKRPAPPPGLGSASLDLEVLASLNSINEADNVRWSLAQDTPAGQKLYSAEGGVDWKTLRRAELSGAIPIPANSYWSFNDAFGYLPGYKYASGVYAGGHCALATVLRAAAHKAGLATYYKLHWWAIPGFSYYESVSIWWGRDDLVIRNHTAQSLSLAWALDARHLIVSVVATQDLK